MEKKIALAVLALSIILSNCSCNRAREKISVDEKGNLTKEIFDKQGRLKKIVSYSSDTVPNGRYVSYYSNGNIKQEKNYENGRVEGLVKQYFEKEGTLEAELEYKNDKANGGANYYYPSGEIESTVNFYEGVAIGEVVWYQKSGMPESYGYYDTLGLEKYWCKYDSIGNIVSEKGALMYDYSIDKSETYLGEPINIQVSIARPPLISIEAAIAYLTSDGDSVAKGSATHHPKVEVGHHYSFEKSFPEEGRYKLVFALKLTNKMTADVDYKYIREDDWVVNVQK